MSTIFYPTRNTFYIKKNVTQDVVVKPEYGDLYGAANTTANVSNQPNGDLYLAQSTAPTIPVYGGGELSECSLRYYFNTVKGNYTSTQPRLKVYKADDDITLTRGNIPTILDENVTCFTSYVGDSWLVESFNEVNQGFGDRQNYTKSYTQSFPPDVYTITGKQLHTHMSNKGLFELHKGGWIKSDWWERQLGNSRKWQLLETTEAEYGTGDYHLTEPLIGFWTEAINAGTKPWPGIFNSKPLENWVKIGAVPDVESRSQTQQTFNAFDTNFVGRVTQFNSIFNFYLFMKN